jgi:hypothetical protein
LFPLYYIRRKNGKKASKNKIARKRLNRLNFKSLQSKLFSNSYEYADRRIEEKKPGTTLKGGLISEKKITP